MSSKTKMVWPHSEHLGQNENFAILFVQHSQHRQTFWAPCAVEQMHFNPNAFLFVFILRTRVILLVDTVVVVACTC